MSTTLKYHVVEAQTLAALKRHRELIEEALRDSHLPPEVKRKLLDELDVTRRDENQALMDSMGEDIDDDFDEEQNEDECDEEGDGEGSHGGSGKREGGSGSGGGGGPSNKEIMALLFYQAEGKTFDHNEMSPNMIEEFLEESLAAATVMLDRDRGIAQIPQPYMNEVQANPTQSPLPTDLLPLIEKQVMRAGAHTMYLRAQTVAAKTLQTNHGYQPLGVPYESKGMIMQRMRKVLPRLKSPGTDPV